MIQVFKSYYLNWRMNISGIFFPLLSLTMQGSSRYCHKEASKNESQKLNTKQIGITEGIYFDI